MSDTNLPGLIIPIEARVSQLEKSLKKAADAQNRSARSMERRAQQSADRMARSYANGANGIAGSFTRLATSVGRSLNPAGLAIGAVGSVASAAGIRRVVSELSELAKVSDRVNLSTREFQGLEFGFGQAGVKVDEMTRAMENFAQRIGEAQQGGGSLLQTLQSFNVSLTDDNGRTRSQFELIREMANILQRLPNQQQRLAVAQAAFGNAGRDMVNALAQGAENLDQMIQKADEAGLIMDEAVLRRAEEIDDRYDLLKRRVSTNMRGMALNIADWTCRGLVPLL